MGRSNPIKSKIWSRPTVFGHIILFKEWFLSTSMIFSNCIMKYWNSNRWNIYWILNKNWPRLCYHRQRHRKLSIFKNDLSNTFLKTITLDRLFNEAVKCLGSFDIMIRNSKIAGPWSLYNSQRHVIYVSDNSWIINLHFMKHIY